MQYPLTFYVDSLPPGIGGCANGPVIRILKKYKGDRGLLCHEMEHVKQWWIATIVSAVLLAAGLYHFQEPLWGAIGSIGTHGLLYKLIPAYRLWAEVQAHKVQLQYSPTALSHFAKRIATKYSLNVTPEKAEQLLKTP
jgi:hypothetical protein